MDLLKVGIQSFIYRYLLSVNGSLQQMLHLLLYLCLLFCSAICCLGASGEEFITNSSLPIPQKEFEALFDLYTSTEGFQWTWKNDSFGVKWNFSSPYNNPCAENWQGVVCALFPPFTTNHIVILSLPIYNMHGTVPPTIANLSLLHNLDFTHNRLEGTLPESIHRLTQLTRLVIQNNAIRGTIPAYLGSLSNLEELEFGLNAFTGTIPPELGQLTQLTGLVMGNNLLRGSVPESLGNLNKLSLFDAYHCNLTGPIPESFGNFTRMLLFNMYNNSLTGSIPAGLSNWKALQSITIGINKLTGPLLPSLGSISTLQYIDFQRNKFTGNIPSEWSTLQELKIIYLNSNALGGGLDVFCKLQNITQLYLSANEFGGTLPECLGDLRDLTELYVDSNKFVGSIPDSLHTLTKLIFLDMDTNAFAGSIPSSFVQLRQLGFLALFNNRLTGSVPPGFSQLSELSYLLLQNNQLSGPIDIIFNASVQLKLTTVQLSANDFTGSLPEEPFKIAVFEQFSAVDNCLKSTIPQVICNCPSLHILAIDGIGTSYRCHQDILPGVSRSYINANRIGGTIPTCLFQLPNLTTLHLSGNSIDGSLPSNLQLGPSLVDLALSHNLLTGRIPRSIQERSWYSLDLSYNRFSGGLLPSFNSIPVRFDLNKSALGHHFIKTYTTAEAQLILENNRLSGAIPESVQSLSDISILNGNVFSCNLAQTNLPKNDNAKDSYQCGSGFFDAQYFAWLILTGCFVLGAVGVWWWRGALVQHYEIIATCFARHHQWWTVLDSPQLDGKLKNFRYVDEVAMMLGRVACCCTALIVVCLTPVHAVLSYYYAWAVSSMFQSGEVPFAVLFVLYLLLMCAFFRMLKVFTQWYLRIEDDTQPHMSLLASRASEYVEEVTNTQIVSAYVAFFSVNFALVIGVNVAFVYIALYADNTVLLFSQLFLSLFKSFWNTLGANLVMRWAFQTIATDTSGADFINTLLFASLFNNIAIPCLVIAMISPNCFYNLFVTAPSVTYQYTYLVCAIFVADRCLVNDPRVATTSFSPPFTYSYQCAAQFLTSYCATFLYLAMETAFLLPVLEVLLIEFYKRSSPGSLWHRFLKYNFMSRIVKPVYTHKTPDRDTFYLCYEANLFLVQLMTFLGIILTFGVAFPPLAAAMLVAMLSLIWSNKLIAGRYISSALEKNAPQYLDIIEKDCRSVGFQHLSKLKVAAWMLITFSCCFYGLIFFDTLGDAVGYDKTLWVLVVLPLISFGLMGADGLRNALCRRYMSPEAEDLRGRRSSWLGADSDLVDIASLNEGNSMSSGVGMELTLFSGNEAPSRSPAGLPGDLGIKVAPGQAALDDENMRARTASESSSGGTISSAAVTNALHEKSPRSRGRGVTWTPDV